MRNFPTALRSPAILVAVVSVACLLWLDASAGAATFVVTNTDNAGPGSLRQRISQANSGGDGADTIVFRATGTIDLASALPFLRTDLTIEGPGARRLTVRRDSGRGYPIFSVPSCGCSVELSAITVANAAGAPGIVQASSLTVSRTVIRGSHNNRGLGGGIRSLGGTLDVLRSTVSGNSALAGGGIFIDSGRVTVARSTLNGNVARGGNGGGIFNDSGRVTVAQSTLSGNVARGGNGGGILNGKTVLTVLQVTFSGNSARAGGALAGIPPITLQSAIVANSPHGGNCATPPVFPSAGYNLSDDASCNLTGTGDQQDTEPLLRPLDYYGGPTRTFALRPASPPVDAGFAAGALIDQRGRPRIADYPGVPGAEGGDNSDIGSFELEPAPSGAWRRR
jgi:hypothetical protein